MRLQRPYDDPQSDSEWSITLTGWKAKVVAFVLTFSCVLGFLWMFLSVQGSIARLIGGVCQ